MLLQRLSLELQLLCLTLSSCVASRSLLPIPCMVLQRLLACSGALHRLLLLDDVGDVTDHPYMGSGLSHNERVCSRLSGLGHLSLDGGCPNLSLSLRSAWSQWNACGTDTRCIC